MLARMTADQQRTLRMLFTSNWYPVGLGHALDAAIVAELGDGSAAVFERLGAASADRNLGSVHSSYLTRANRTSSWKRRHRSTRCTTRRAIALTNAPAQ